MIIEKVWENDTFEIIEYKAFNHDDISFLIDNNIIDKDKFKNENVYDMQFGYIHIRKKGR